MVDFKLETFDMIKLGLEEIGEAIQQIPTLLSSCQHMEKDIESLA